jgi:putative spermidine/putrescine transport system permease protein
MPLSTLERSLRLGTFGIAALVLAFPVLPLIVIVPLSFTSGSLLIYPLPGFSLRWYADFFGNDLWVGAIGHSLIIGLCATLLATATGTMAALGLARAEFRFKRVIFAFLATPLVVPLIIAAVGIFFFYARFGLVGSFSGLVLAHTVLALPFVVVTVTATLQGHDPALGRAGASLGAPPFLVFFRIDLPIILPGILSGALFAFVTSFDETVVTIFIGGPRWRTLPLQIWSGVRESISPTVTAAAVVLFLVSVALVVTVELLRRRGERLRA